MKRPLLTLRLLVVAAGIAFFGGCQAPPVTIAPPSVHLPMEPTFGYTPKQPVVPEPNQQYLQPAPTVAGTQLGIPQGKSPLEHAMELQVANDQLRLKKELLESRITQLEEDLRKNNDSLNLAHSEVLQSKNELERAHTQLTIWQQNLDRMNKKLDSLGNPNFEPLENTLHLLEEKLGDHSMSSGNEQSDSEADAMTPTPDMTPDITPGVAPEKAPESNEPSGIQLRSTTTIHQDNSGPALTMDAIHPASAVKLNEESHEQRDGWHSTPRRSAN